MNKTRSRLKNLLLVQDLRKRNHNFSGGKKLLPLSSLQHQFPRVMTVDVRKIIINKRIKTGNKQIGRTRTT